jgi:hypothetical protein
MLFNQGRHWVSQRSAVTWPRPSDPVGSIGDVTRGMLPVLVAVDSRAASSGPEATKTTNVEVAGK